MTKRNERLSHTQEDCPFYPAETSTFDPNMPNQIYKEYRAMCRDCGREWDMIIQVGKSWDKARTVLHVNI